jgi:pimeloyl-ACP methyl ester carboxylesterase
MVEGHERLVHSNGIELCVQLYPAAVSATGKLPVLLIMGLGMQGPSWPPVLIEGLVKAGHTVATFDNRDIGLSTKDPAWGQPNIPWAIIRQMLGLKVHAPYLLSDMAADTVGLLDALEWPRAHVVGVSMGGMIAQVVAADYPQRVASLGLIMTTVGKRSLPGPTAKARSALLGRPPRNASHEQLIEHSMGIVRAIGSPAFAQDPQAMRARLSRLIQRAYHPRGVARQLLAIAASGSRTYLMPRISQPTVIIHGEDDPLVPVAHGRDLAQRLPHARLRIVPGMGHDLPPQVCAIVVDEVLRSVEETQG